MGKMKRFFFALLLAVPAFLICSPDARAAGPSVISYLSTYFAGGTNGQVWTQQTSGSPQWANAGGGASSLGATINVGNVVNSVVASGQVTYNPGGTYTQQHPELQGPSDQPFVVAPKVAAASAAGQPTWLYGGDGGVTSGAPGAAVIFGGSSYDNVNAGADVDLQGGSSNGSGTSAGGIGINAGSSVEGPGGSVNISASGATTAGSTSWGGGNLTLAAGGATNAGTNGQVNIQAGGSSATGTNGVGGPITCTAGAGGANGGAGGVFSGVGGAAGHTGVAGGASQITGGVGAGNGTGGDALATGGSCGAGTGTGNGGRFIGSGGLGGQGGKGGLAEIIGGPATNSTNNNSAGGALVSGGLSVGTGTADVLVQTSYMVASGSSVQTPGDRWRCTGKTKTLSTTTATLTQFADIVLGTTLTGGHGVVYYSVKATSASDIDTAAGHFDFTVVNKAGALTVTAGTITDIKASTNGSITSGITVTQSTTHCQLNVTPAFTTIVPTGVVLDWQIVWDGNPVTITVQ